MIFMNLCTLWELQFTKWSIFRAPQIAKMAVLELLNSHKWFHVKYNRQKNPQISTLWEVDDLLCDRDIFFCLENEFHVVRLNSTKSRFTKKKPDCSGVSFNWVIMNNGHHKHQNGNHQEFPNVTVIESRCVKYLLTKLRNKETCSKVQWSKSSHSFKKFQFHSVEIS